jgi:hypothetical protein
MKASCDEAETQLALTNDLSRMLLEQAGNLEMKGFKGISTRYLPFQVTR